MVSERKICVGVITGAHGVRGQVRLRSFTDEPGAVVDYGPLQDASGTRRFDLKLQHATKDGFVATLRGVEDRDAAEALRGTKLYVERSALAPVEAGVYYEADLVGLSVRQPSKPGEDFGKVLAVHNYGAGVFLEVGPTQGASFMLPFNDSCVPQVDVGGGFATIVVPEGWLEPEAPPAPNKALKTRGAPRAVRNAVESGS